MEEERVAHRNGSHRASRREDTGRNHRWPSDDAGDPIECTGKNCRSCTAVLIADCVAVCCCPCAVVSFFGLAFFKAPWMMGRRCLGLGKKKGRRRLKKKKKVKKKKKKCDEGTESDGDIDGNSRKERVEVKTLEIGTGFEEEEHQEENVSARFEAEKIWLELYQLGHLGFGRVSFTGIPSQDGSIPSFVESANSQ